MRVGKQFGVSSFQIPLWKYSVEVNKLYFHILFITATRFQYKEVNYDIPNPYMELQKFQRIADNWQPKVFNILSNVAYCLFAHTSFS